MLNFILTIIAAVFLSFLTGFLAEETEKEKEKPTIVLCFCFALVMSAIAILKYQGSILSSGGIAAEESSVAGMKHSVPYENVGVVHVSDGVIAIIRSPTEEMMIGAPGYYRAYLFDSNNTPPRGKFFKEKDENGEVVFLPHSSMPLPPEATPVQPEG